MEQKHRYNQIWESGDVIEPGAWSVWEIIKNFQNTTNLEIGPGNFPKIPIKNGYFLDISKTAIKNLKKLGGKAIVGDIIKLPYEKNLFDLIVAIEVMEHIENDKKAFSEIARVLKPKAHFLFSVPLKMDLYTDFDKIVGHKRRYEIKDLQKLISSTGFKILKYRYPSLYPKIMEKTANSLGLKNFVCKKQGHTNFFHAPKRLINTGTKIFAFLEKKGAPQWQTDIKNLCNYPDKAIVLFCQKK